MGRFGNVTQLFILFRKVGQDRQQRTAWLGVAVLAMFHRSRGSIENRPNLPRGLACFPYQNPFAPQYWVDTINQSSLSTIINVLVNYMIRPSDPTAGLHSLRLRREPILNVFIDPGVAHSMPDGIVRSTWVCPFLEDSSLPIER